LSTKSRNTLQKLGQSLLAAYAYNNFDVDLKSQVLTAESSSGILQLGYLHECAADAVHWIG
ncbi:hypothetical protein PAXRUDRAFT_153105, partial [Paxillus rubicundulus Ve08.2h10]